MRYIVAPLALCVGLLMAPAGSAFAANPHSGGSTGQPNQSCGSATAPRTPGHAMMAPGSAFNPDGRAGMVYAGQQLRNSKNLKSVAQYDCACFQVSHH